MAKPKRIQRKRTKGWKMPPNTVAVSRPSLFGNPFVGDTCVEDYRRWLAGKMSVAEFTEKNHAAFVHSWDCSTVRGAAKELRGKNLACWCALDQPCHADVLLEIANKG